MVKGKLTEELLVRRGKEDIWTTPHLGKTSQPPHAPLDEMIQTPEDDKSRQLQVRKFVSRNKRGSDKYGQRER